MDPRPCDNPEIHSPASSFFSFSLRACLLSLAALLLLSSTTRFVAADLACSCFVAALFQPTDPDSAPEPEPHPEEEPRPTTTTTTTMAILDGEKRSRGLRVPSLASLKSFHKKSSDASQHKVDALPETPTSATSSSGIPWHASSKRLPPNPPSAPMPMQAPAPMRVPPPSASASAFGLDAVPMGDFGSDRYPMPSSHQHHHQHQQQPSGNLVGPSVQRSLSNGSQRTADSEPLEDFIPEPETEPEIDDAGVIYSSAPPPAGTGAGTGVGVDAAAMHPISNDEEPNGNGNGNGNHHYHNHNHMIPENGVLEDNDDDGVVVDDDDDYEDDWEPPAVDVAAPLGKLHFACYQEHRSMPTSANVWHAVPCMTCQKLDREVRHRCVFCCLRICQGCYQGLLKCQRRSVGELLGMIQG